MIKYSTNKQLEQLTDHSIKNIFEKTNKILD